MYISITFISDVVKDERYMFFHGHPGRLVQLLPERLTSDEARTNGSFSPFSNVLDIAANSLG